MGPTTKWERWGGAAAIAGGLLWIGSYGIGAGVGVATGKYLPAADAPGALGALAGYGLRIGVVLLAVALFGLRARLRGAAQGLGIAGTVFASLALALGVAGTALSMGAPTGMGIFALHIGCILLGIALLRAGVAPRGVNVLVLAMGVAFFPLIVATGPLEGVIPSYFSADFPFSLTGIVFILAGVALLTGGAQSARRPSLTATYHRA